MDIQQARRMEYLLLFSQISFGPEATNQLRPKSSNGKWNLDKCSPDEETELHITCLLKLFVLTLSSYPLCTYICLMDGNKAGSIFQKSLSKQRFETSL